MPTFSSRTQFTRDHSALSALMTYEAQRVRKHLPSLESEPEAAHLCLSLWSKPMQDDAACANLHLQLNSSDTLAGVFAATPALWPIADSALASVVLQHVLDYAAEPEDLLAEAVRCLRGHGELLVFGFRNVSAAHISGAWRLQPPNWISGQSWARTCRALGLSDVVIEPFGVGWPWLKEFDSSTAFGLTRSLPNLASVYVLRAKKRGVRANLLRVSAQRQTEARWAEVGGRAASKSTGQVSEHLRASLAMRGTEQMSLAASAPERESRAVSAPEIMSLATAVRQTRQFNKDVAQ